MANIIKKILQSLTSAEKHREGEELKTMVLKGRDKDIGELKKINRNVKLMLAEGSIEIIVTNVKGVIEQDYKKPRKTRKI